MGLFERLFRGQTVEASTAVRLNGSGRVGVVGESHYQPALKLAAQGKAVKGFDDAVTVEAILAPEPTNKHDRNAVQIQVSGRPVGYLARDLAREYQPILLDMLHRGEYGWCVGKIMGGGRHKSYGIHLHLAPPSRVLFANATDEVELIQGDRMVTVGGFDPEAVPALPADEYGMFPPLVGTFSLGEIVKGKDAGQPCLDVAISGTKIGAFTAKMTDRYMPLVGPVLDAGGVPGCEVTVMHRDGTIKAWAMMPEV